MTQHQLILEYLKYNDSITPAKMGGVAYQGHTFGSETSKRCRELRAMGTLRSENAGKFERFYLAERESMDRNEINHKLEILRKRWLLEQDETRKEIIKRQGLALRRALEAEEYASQVKQALL